MWLIKVRCVLRFFINTSGSTAIEYGLIIGFVSAAMLATLPEIKTNLAAAFVAIANAFAAR
ncbi:Flp family type IVb pilin [Aureimonas psammosilenae]|uniref:Flp family type IVb pilin n=1 Tax=Aureimonas psammosilenae TaxID=2495496 RepID=UPI0012610F51|nr:Flp family type IVb pilin [Aureimonas psammosilenae]